MYLMLGDFASGSSIADSTVVKHGKYTFKGSVEGGRAADVYIKAQQRENTVYATIALENAKITVHTDSEGQTTVSGTENNDRYQEFLNAKKPHEKRFYTVYNAYEASAKTPEDERKINEEREVFHRFVTPMTFEYVKNNVNNPAFWNTLNNCAITSPLEQQKELIAAADEYTRQQPVIQNIIKRVDILEKTALGRPYIDLRMQNPEGKEIALSDYVGKGKVVMIDFWASWCRPCRAELPNVVAAYKEFKKKGFEIVGVSFDSDHDRWVKAIQDEGLEWPQMSDLKGWESAGAKAYAITGIPATLLLDKDGKIIARNLYGEELHKKLAEIFASK